MHRGARDKAGTVTQVVAQFNDAATATTEYDWIIMSLRHEIYKQRGPALGTLSQSDRNLSMDQTSTAAGSPFRAR